MLSLLTCLSTAILAEDVNKSGHNDCCKKSSCSPTPLSHPSTIACSGNYCLTKDIKGTIVIAADNVVLDLNSHEIDANGAAHAVSAHGPTGVTIKNGSIVNSSAAGINITACQEVVVTDITFRNNADISLCIEAESVGICPDFTVTNPSQGIWVANLDISQGNRAMLFSGCNELSVKNCFCYDNLNTIPNAVVGVEHCNNVLLEEVFADNNTKDIPGQGALILPLFGAETAVMLVLASNNVQVKNCTTNENASTLEMTALQVTGIDVHVTGGMIDCIRLDLTKGIIIDGHQSNGNTVVSGTLIGIAQFQVPNTIVRNSQTSTNIITESKRGVGFPTQDFLFGLGCIGCPGAHVSNHQSNQNAALNPITQQGGEAYGIFMCSGLDGNPSNGSIIEDCQTNNNGDLIETSKGTGICFGFGVLVVPSNGGIIRRCQANGNKGSAAAFGIACYWNDAVIEENQADFNSSFGAPDIGNNTALGLTCGISVTAGVTSARITSCSACNNTCANNFGVGIDVAGFPQLIPNVPPAILNLPPHKAIVQNCVTDNNISTGNVFVGEVTVAGTTLTVNSVLAGSLNVGDYVSGGTITPGTTITALGVGTVTLSTAQAVMAPTLLTAQRGAQFTGSVSGTVLTVNAIPAPVGVIMPTMVISGVGITPGTTIESWATGTGGAGTYNLSVASAPTAVQPIEAILPISFGAGVRINEATACEVLDNAAGENQFGYFNNTGIPFNSYFGNRAEDNLTADFSAGIPTGNIVVYDKATGTFVPTPPNRWSNIQIFPS